MGKGVLFQDTIQNLRIHRFLPSGIWLLRHSIKRVCPVEKFAKQICDTPEISSSCSRISPLWHLEQFLCNWSFFSIAEGMQICPSSLSQGKRLQSWLETQTLPKSTNACRDLPFYLQDGDSSLFEIWCVLFPWVELIRQKSRVRAVSPNQFRWPNPMQRVSTCQIEDSELGSSPMHRVSPCRQRRVSPHQLSDPTHDCQLLRLSDAFSVTLGSSTSMQHGFFVLPVIDLSSAQASLESSNASSHLFELCSNVVSPCLVATGSRTCTSWSGGKSFFTHLLHPFRQSLASSLKSWTCWLDTKSTSGFDLAARSIHLLTSCSSFSNADVQQRELRVGFWCRHIWCGSWGPANSVEQPVKSNSVGSRHMSHCWTSAFGNHLYCSLVVFKDVQHSSIVRRIRVWRNKIDIWQFVVFFRSWCLVLRTLAHLGRFVMQRVSPCQLISVCLIRFWM